MMLSSTAVPAFSISFWMADQLPASSRSESLRPAASACSRRSRARLMRLERERLFSSLSRNSLNSLRR